MFQISCVFEVFAYVKSEILVMGPQFQQKIDLWSTCTLYALYMHSLKVILHRVLSIPASGLHVSKDSWCKFSLVGIIYPQKLELWSVWDLDFQIRGTILYLYIDKYTYKYMHTHLNTLIIYTHMYICTLVSSLCETSQLLY